MPKLDEAHRQTDRELAVLTQRVASLYRETYDDMQETVTTYFEGFRKRDEAMMARVNAGEISKDYYKQWRLNQIGRGRRFEIMRDALAERYTQANELAIAYINGDMPKIYAMNRTFSINDAVKQANGMLDGISFTMWDEWAVKRLIVEQPDIMPHYPNSKALKRGIDLKFGKRKITEIVTHGLLSGSGTEKIASDLQRDIKNMNRASAVRAARTAITEAENAGRQDAAEELSRKGAILEKVWRCVHDGKTRPEHAAADGQSVPSDTPFTVGGEKLMFPGDHSLGAGGWNIYNCRCTRETVVTGFKSVLSDEQRKRENIKVIS